MTTFSRITYTEVITIDDKTYTIHNIDFTDNINQLVNDEVIEPDSQSIIDTVIDDVVNNCGQ